MNTRTLPSHLLERLPFFHRVPRQQCTHITVILPKWWCPGLQHVYLSLIWTSWFCLPAHCLFLLYIKLLHLLQQYPPDRAEDFVTKRKPMSQTIKIYLLKVLEESKHLNWKVMLFISYYLGSDESLKGSSYSLLLCPVLTVKPLSTKGRFTANTADVSNSKWLYRVCKCCFWNWTDTVSRCFPPENELYPIANRATNRREWQEGRHSHQQRSTSNVPSHFPVRQDLLITCISNSIMHLYSTIL